MRPLLICVNVFAVVVGITMAGFGGWMLQAGTSLFEMLNALDRRLGSGVSMEKLIQVADKKGLLKIMAIAITVSGCIAIATGVLGIVAVVQKSSLLAIIYKLTVFMMLVSHITGTAVILFKKASLEDEIASAMTRHQRLYFVARTSLFNKTSELRQAVTIFFEHMHISFECCGVLTPGDITNSSSFLTSINQDPKYNAKIPASCCKVTNKDNALAGKEKLKLKNPRCPYAGLNSTEIHKKACFHPVRRLADKVILPILVVCGIFAIVLATALGTMAAQMCTGFSDDDNDSDYDSEDEDDFDSDSDSD